MCTVMCNKQTSRTLTVQLQVHPNLVYHRGGFTAASSKRPVDSMPPQDSASGSSACVTGDAEPHRPHAAGHRRAGMVSKTSPAGSFYPIPW